MTMSELPDSSGNMHAVREQARNWRYNNAAEEADTLNRIDTAVFDAVRDYENNLVGAAEAFQERGRIPVAEATEILAAIRGEVVEQLRQQEPTAELAHHSQMLLMRARKTLSQLEEALRESEWHEARLADPAGNHRAMLEKWPVQRSFTW